MRRLSGLLVAIALAVTACAGDPEPQLPPSAAAQQVTALLLLDESVTTCLDGAFAADPALAGILNAGDGEQLATDRVTTSLAAIRRCADPDELARGIGRVAAVAAADPDAAAPCIADQLPGLSVAEQDLLLLWALNPRALDNAAGAKLVQLAPRLGDACGIALPTGLPGEDQPLNPTDRGGSTVIGIDDDGATTQTR